jgi:hypothetical protein
VSEPEVNEARERVIRAAIACEGILERRGGHGRMLDAEIERSAAVQEMARLVSESKEVVPDGPRKHQQGAHVASGTEHPAHPTNASEPGDDHRDVHLADDICYKDQREWSGTLTIDRFKLRAAIIRALSAVRAEGHAAGVETAALKVSQELGEQIERRVAQERERAALLAEALGGSVCGIAAAIRGGK